MKRQYLVRIDKDVDSDWGASVPDLPGCAVVGYATPAQARRSIAQAIKMHIQGMIEDGDAVPRPTARGEYVAA